MFEGDAKAALNAFVERGLLTEADGQAAAISAVVDHVDGALLGERPDSALILARTNAEVAAIGQEARGRPRNQCIVTGEDVAGMTVTPSGHPTSLMFASGDRIRFLTRNDDLGVVNGTVATITDISAIAERSPVQPSGNIMIEARIGPRTVRFGIADVADKHGRA